ncbi:extended synaptotagmin-2-like isoform X2 [Penaeus indicus]|uniref:extended synaptotagmin-2-like isoform X2 n=1 Tax=Penaeus indicus TaxID=29960 RepID=UPI00300C5429
MTTQTPSGFSLQRALHMLGGVIESVDSIRRFLDERTGTFDVHLFLSYVLKGLFFRVLASWSYVGAAFAVFCFVSFTGREAKETPRARRDAATPRARDEEARKELPPSASSMFSLPWILQMLGVAIESVDRILRFLDDNTGTFDVYLFLSYVLKGFLFNILASWSYVGAGLVIFYCVSSRGHEAQLDKKIALARTDAATFKDLYKEAGIELPPWITFPEEERAEWLSKIINQLWPNVEEYARDYCKYIMQPYLASRLKFINFKFSKIHLGDVAPMVTGVKVHNSTSRHRITMDVNIVFTGNNSFEISAIGFEAGIKEFKISGQMRIVLSPLENYAPFIRGFQAFFLRKPDFHFKFTKVAEPLNYFEDVFGDLMLKTWVFPEKYCSVNDTLDQMPVVQGVIRLTSVRAEDLAREASRCTISLRVQEHTAETTKRSCNPIWNDLSYEYWVENRDSEVVEFEIYDGNSFIGCCELEVQRIYEGIDEANPIQLTDATLGRLYVNATWYDLKNEVIPYETEEGPFHAAVLVVWVDSVIGLTGKPNPTVQLRVGDDKPLKTRKEQKANNPVFEEDFFLFVKDPRTEELKVEVIDMKTVQSLGALKFSIVDLLTEPNLEILAKEYSLDGSSAFIQLSMSLRIMKPNCSTQNAGSSTSIQDVTDAVPTASTEPTAETTCVEEVIPAVATPLTQNSPSSTCSEESLDRATPTSSAATREPGRIQLTVKYEPNILTVVVHQIENLPVGKSGELPDTKVKLHLLRDRSKDIKQKTSLIRGDCNPKYDERFECAIQPIELTQCILEVRVIKKRGISSLAMGQVILDCSSLPDSSEMPQWYDLTPAADCEREGSRQSIRSRRWRSSFHRITK